MAERFSLPQEEMLREYLAQPSVPSKEIRAVLRSRGLFLGAEEKKLLIPELVKTGISPFEFAQIDETIQKKEENVKIRTQTIRSDDNSDTLASHAPDDFDIHQVIDTHFENFEICGAPSFIPQGGDPNTLHLEFRVIRRDFSSALSRNSSEFDGYVSVSKSNEDGQIVITSSHTSPETLKVCKAVTKKMVAHLRDVGLVKPDTEVNSIRFTDFDNARRVEFLRRLASSSFGKVATFKSLRDMGLTPALTEAAPKDIKWMVSTIRRLAIQGQDLQEVHLIKDEKNHPHITLYRLEAEYDITYKNFNGNCYISYEFSNIDKASLSDSELVVTIEDVQLAASEEGEPGIKPPKTEVKAEIMRILDPKKIKLHQEIIGAASE